MIPCVMYTRVSSEEQSKLGYSLPYQHAKLEQHALEHNLTVVERFEDVHTAKESGRPGFAGMLSYLESHPKVNRVLVHRLDRLSRNLYQYAQLVEQLGIQVHSVMEPAENNAAGRMTHGMSAVVARYHSDNLSAEVKKGLTQKFIEGGCVTRAPPGYRNISRTRTEKAKVVVDDKIAAVVHAAFERYAGGDVSLRDLAAEVFDLGLRSGRGRHLTADWLKRLLMHPFYAGHVRYRGEVRAGTHAAIVPQALFDQVQRILRRRSSIRGSKGTKFFLLRGLLYCERCGSRLTAEDHPAKKVQYYRCLPALAAALCPELYTPVKSLDAQVEALLPLIELTPDRRADANTVLDGENALREAAQRAEGPDLTARRHALDEQLLKLGRAYVASDMPADEYRDLRRGLDNDAAAVDERLRFLERDFTAVLAEQEAAIEMASSLTSYYETAASPEDRKACLHRIFKRIMVANKEIKGIEYNQPFDLLLENPLDTGSKRLE